MNISEINLYPDMDNKIVDILSLSNDPSSLYAAASIKHLCDRVEELDKQLSAKDVEIAHLQQEIRTGRHMSATITLDSDSAESFCNAAELSEAKQENAILRRALVKACEYACAPDGLEMVDGCPPHDNVCEKCTGHAGCWNQYFIHQAREERK